MHELHSKDARYILTLMCSAAVFNLYIGTTNSTSMRSAKACGTKTYRGSSFKWNGRLSNKGISAMKETMHASNSCLADFSGCQTRP